MYMYIILNKNQIIYIILNHTDSQEEKFVYLFGFKEINAIFFCSM